MFDAYQQRQHERPWRRYVIVGVVAAIAGIVGVKLLRHHAAVTDREDAENSRREREALDEPQLVTAPGFAFEAPGRVEHRDGDYDAGSVQGGGLSTGFGATWRRERSAGDLAHRAEAIAEVRRAFLAKRDWRVKAHERPITLAGAPAYETELRLRDGDGTFPYYVAITITECDGRMVTLWIDRESGVADENRTMLASYRCTPGT